MRAVFRILDANFNRAREALRVAEEYVRFVLDDPALAAGAKSMRSDLQRIYQSLPAGAMLTARDTPGDVGTTLTSDTEHVRESPAEVAVAACKRLTEALRTIEEYVKCVAAEQAPAIEKLRYRAYAFEQRLGPRANLTARFRDVRVYVLLTTELCKLDPVVTAHAVIAGGADCIQLREKHLPDRQWLDLARTLRALTQETQTLFIVNDRPDIAVAAGADGVHLGADDLPIPEARRILGGGALVGLSTHSIDEARSAAAAEPDYIGVGPMFPSPTKADLHAAGVGLLEQVVREIEIPHVAIGGITAENVARVIAAGARRVAVCQAVIAADDPAEATRQIARQLPRDAECPPGGA